MGASTGASTPTLIPGSRVSPIKLARLLTPLHTSRARAATTTALGKRAAVSSPEGKKGSPGSPRTAAGAGAGSTLTAPFSFPSLAAFGATASLGTSSGEKRHSAPAYMPGTPGVSTPTSAGPMQAVSQASPSRDVYSASIGTEISPQAGARPSEAPARRLPEPPAGRASEALQGRASEVQTRRSLEEQAMRASEAQAGRPFAAQATRVSEAQAGRTSEAQAEREAVPWGVWHLEHARTPPTSFAAGHHSSHVTPAAMQAQADVMEQTPVHRITPFGFHAFLTSPAPSFVANQQQADMAHASPRMATMSTLGTGPHAHVSSSALEQEMHAHVQQQLTLRDLQQRHSSQLESLAESPRSFSHHGVCPGAAAAAAASDATAEQAAPALMQHALKSSCDTLQHWAGSPSVAAAQSPAPWLSQQPSQQIPQHSGPGLHEQPQLHAHAREVSSAVLYQQHTAHSQQNQHHLGQSQAQQQAYKPSSAGSQQPSSGRRYASPRSSPSPASTPSLPASSSLTSPSSGHRYSGPTASAHGEEANSHASRRSTSRGRYLSNGRNEEPHSHHQHHHQQQQAIHYNHLYQEEHEQQERVLHEEMRTSGPRAREDSAVHSAQAPLPRRSQEQQVSGFQVGRRMDGAGVGAGRGCFGGCTEGCSIEPPPQANKLPC